MRRYLNFVNGEYSDPRTRGPPNRYARGFSKFILVDWAKKQTKTTKNKLLKYCNSLLAHESVTPLEWVIGFTAYLFAGI